MNEDLLAYLKSVQEKSPYYDFTSTLEDYIKQFKELDKKYPENTNNVENTNVEKKAPPTFTFGSINTNNSAPLFSFGGTNNIFSTPANNALVPNNNTNTSANNNTDATTTNDNKDEGDNNADEEDAPPPEPNVEKYEETGAIFSVKCKLYEKGKGPDGEITINLLGLGQMFVKAMEDQNKRQVIFRQDPDLRRVLLNEVITPNQPVKQLPKAVQMVFPLADGEIKSYIVKVKDDLAVHRLTEHLKF